MWHDHMWSGPWMMGWGGMPMLLFWLVVIGLVISLISGLSAKRSDSTDDSSLQILKNRLASGDIDQKQFDALYQKLKQVK